MGDTITAKDTIVGSVDNVEQTTLVAEIREIIGLAPLFPVSAGRCQEPHEAGLLMLGGEALCDICIEVEVSP